MVALRIGSLVASLAVLVGCAATHDVAKDCCASYEKPSFELSFFPETMLDKEPIVEISEDSNGASIRVNWSGSRNRIADSSGYLRLKRRILASTLWNERASENVFFGPFTGASRDILTVRSGDRGICLQGSDVPRGWRQEIIRLASRGEGTKLGEQVSGGKGGQSR